jgi:pimeloyl-ACP methyl ester carboxylesterase
VQIQEQAVRFDIDGASIDADIAIPADALGLVVFVQGSGSSRQSPRNQYVAGHLRAEGLGTVLVDLLTSTEERQDQFSGHLRFDITFLARRVTVVMEELRAQTALPLGLFGASTGSAAALVAAANHPRKIRAVVSRGGRPDLAGNKLPLVMAPTLFIVGGDDHEVRELNRRAIELMRGEVRLEIVPGATHLFHEPGALEAVSHLGADWFKRHLDRGDDNVNTRPESPAR